MLIHTNGHGVWNVQSEAALLRLWRWLIGRMR